MRRRALLSLAALSLAGCLSTPDGNGTETDSPTEPTATPTRTQPTESLGVPAAESDCPGVADRIVCVPETDPDAEPISLTAGTRSVALPATVEFTLANDDAPTLSTNYYAWGLWKRVDDEWHHLVPEMVQQPLMHLQPGSSHAWTLTAEHELPASPGRSYISWEAEGTVGGLGGGEYAFTADGWFGDAEGSVGFAVLFDVNAPDLTLEPTARVSESTRDGDTMTVYGEGNGEETYRAELAVTRVENADEATSSGSQSSPDEADEPREVLPEQAAHDYRLRNTLSYVEDGVDRVRYVEKRHAIHPAFGVDEPYTIRYGGELFEVSASKMDSGTN